MGRQIAERPARQRVVDAATDVFAERGYAGSSMQHIADALSIRKASLYKHFDSKDSLYGAVLEQALSPLSAAIDRTLIDADAESAVRSLPTTMLALLSDAPRTARLLMQELVRDDQRLHPLLNDWFEVLFAQGDRATALYAGQPASDPNYARLAMVAMLNVVLGFVVFEPKLPGSRGVDPEFHAQRSKIFRRVIASLQDAPSAAGRRD
jgi:AcrR family transcriptional regulator